MLPYSFTLIWEQMFMLISPMQNFCLFDSQLNEKEGLHVSIPDTRKATMLPNILEVIPKNDLPLPFRKPPMAS